MRSFAVLTAIDVLAAGGLAAWLGTMGDCSWSSLAAVGLVGLALVCTHAVRADIRYATRLAESRRQGHAEPPIGVPSTGTARSPVEPRSGAGSNPGAGE